MKRFFRIEYEISMVGFKDKCFHCKIVKARNPKHAIKMFIKEYMDVIEYHYISKITNVIEIDFFESLKNKK